IVPETGRDPHFHDITRLLTKPRQNIGVFGRIEALAIQSVKNGEIARSDVDLADAVIADFHPQTVCLFHLLIIVLTIAVEPTSHLPVERGMIPVVEHTDVASVDTTSKLELIKEPVQFL